MQPKIYKSLKPCWLLNWVSILRVVGTGSTFFSSKPVSAVTASSDCSLLRPYLETPCHCPCVCACQSYLPKLYLSAAPRAQHLILQSIVFPSSGTAIGSDCQWQAVAQPWTQTWTLPPDQQVVEFFKFYAQKSANQLCGVWIHFKMPKLRTVVSYPHPPDCFKQQTWKRDVTTLRRDNAETLYFPKEYLKCGMLWRPGLLKRILRK